MATRASATSCTIKTLPPSRGAASNTTSARHKTRSERQAFRAIEGTLEAIRGGSIPLVPAHFDNFAFSAGSPVSSDLTLSMDVRPVPFPPSLFQVSLTAHYSVAGQRFDKQVDTLVWQPNPVEP